MNHREAQAILKRIDYPGLTIELLSGDGGAGYVRVSAWREDAQTGEASPQNGRKWRLSEYAVENEVVQTVFAAISAWEEHERREKFRYLGQKVFSPHLDLGKLATALRLGALEEQVRKDPTP